MANADLMALTPGSISRLTQNDTTGQPIVQIIDHKQLGGGGRGQTRHRVLISDGQAFMQGMLATNLNPFVDNGTVRLPPWAVLDREPPRVLLSHRTRLPIRLP